MRIIDLLQMSASSLLKRKVRTILTVLGVMIGVASIVVMVSLGLGLNKATMESLQEYASLTAVSVYPPYNNENSSEKKFLDDEFIKTVEQLPYVEGVSPYLDVDVLAKYGPYEGNFTLRGMPIETLEGMNIEVGQGTLLQHDAEELQLFLGNMVILNFYNAKNYASYWETGELPNIDLMKDSIFYILDRDAYYNSQNGNSEDGKPVRKPKKHLIKVAGVAAGDQESYHPYSYNVYCDIEKLIPVLKKEFKGRPIPGQPLTKKGKPYKEIYYTGLQVNVDDMKHVSEVTKMISDMGYQATNDAEWIESQQKSMRMIEAVLGGIGAVSLLVAAIGITNTMMMSIYERTKEIGIMKVLGCDMRNIGALFLLEAGCIGFIGGVVGLLISYGISGIINYLVGLTGMEVSRISYIPFWLAMISLIFAILVGMVAGFFPARRAMQLSPLAAIRNE